MNRFRLAGALALLSIVFLSAFAGSVQAGGPAYLKQFVGDCTSPNSIAGAQVSLAGQTTFTDQFGNAFIYSLASPSTGNVIISAPGFQPINEPVLIHSGTNHYQTCLQPNSVGDQSPPALLVSRTPAGTVDSSQFITLSVSASDPSGVRWTRIDYQLGSGQWQHIACNGPTCSVPLGFLQANVAVNYDGAASDNLGNVGTSPILSFVVQPAPFPQPTPSPVPLPVDTKPPALSLFRDPAGDVAANTFVRLQASANDESGISSVLISYTVGASGSLQVTCTTGFCQTVIGPLPASTLVTYSAQAIDASINHNVATTPIFSFTTLANPSPSPGPTGSLNVHFEDCSTANPLSNAIVSVGSSSTSTDSHGNAFFNALAAGSYSLAITAPGYKAVSASVTVPANVNVQSNQCSLPVGGVDTTPPAVSITRTPSGAVTSNDQVFFQAKASDASGIQWTEIQYSVDNGLAHTIVCPANYCTANSGPFVPGAVVAYSALAKDGAGNVGTTPVFSFVVGASNGGGNPTPTPTPSPTPTPTPSPLPSPTPSPSPTPTPTPSSLSCAVTFGTLTVTPAPTPTPTPAPSPAPPYTDVAAYSSPITVSDGQPLVFSGDDSTTQLNANAGWVGKLSFDSYSVGSAAIKALKAIFLQGVPSKQLQPGDSYKVIARPTSELLTFLGVEPVPRDRLSIAAIGNNVITVTNSSPYDLGASGFSSQISGGFNLTRVQSSNETPFLINGKNLNAFYVDTYNGRILYKDPTSANFTYLGAENNTVEYTYPSSPSRAAIRLVTNGTRKPPTLSALNSTSAAGIGSLSANTTFTFLVTYVDAAGGESLPYNVTATTGGATGATANYSFNVSFLPVTGASGYRVYNTAGYLLNATSFSTGIIVNTNSTPAGATPNDGLVRNATQVTLQVYEAVRDGAAGDLNGFASIGLYRPDPNYLFNPSSPSPLAEAYNASAPGLNGSINFANASYPRGFVSPGGMRFAALFYSEVVLTYPKRYPHAQWEFGSAQANATALSSTVINTQLYDFLGASQNTADTNRTNSAAGGLLGDGVTGGGFLIGSAGYPAIAPRSSINNLGFYSTVEDTSFFIAGRSYWDGASRKYVGNSGQAYAVYNFSQSIPYHVDTVNGTVAGRPLNDSSIVTNRNVSVRFLSMPEVIAAFDNSSASTISLASSAHFSQMKAGDSINAGNVTLSLVSISPIAVGSASQYYSYFEVSRNGVRIDFFSMAKGSPDYNKNGILVRVRDVVVPQPPAAPVPTPAPPAPAPIPIVIVRYFNASSQPAFSSVSCGNGALVNAPCQAQDASSGNCSAQCTYPVPGAYPVTASIGSVSCSPATFTTPGFGPTGLLAVKIIDGSTFAPLSNAKVSVAGLDQFTDAYGETDFNLTSGQYSVTASLTGYASASANTQVTAGTVTHLTIPLSQSASAPGGCSIQAELSKNTCTVGGDQSFTLRVAHNASAPLEALVSFGSSLLITGPTDVILPPNVPTFLNYSLSIPSGFSSSAAFNVTITSLNGSCRTSSSVPFCQASGIRLEIPRPMLSSFPGSRVCTDVIVSNDDSQTANVRLSSTGDYNADFTPNTFLLGGKSSATSSYCTTVPPAADGTHSFLVTATSNLNTDSASVSLTVNGQGSFALNHSFCNTSGGSGSLNGIYTFQVGAANYANASINYPVYSDISNTGSACLVSNNNADNSPPSVEIFRSPQTNVAAGQNVRLIADATDPSGIQAVRILWRVDNGQVQQQECQKSPTCTIAIGSFNQGQAIEYWAQGVDSSVRLNSADTPHQTFNPRIPQGSEDLIPPSVSISRAPSGSVRTSDTVTLSATSSDSSNIQTTTIYYRVNQGAWFSNSCSSDFCSLTIPTPSAGALVYYYATAQDASQNRNVGMTDINTYIVQPVAPSSSSGSMEFYAYDCSTTAPITGATISVNGFSGVTDSSGYANLPQSDFTGSNSSVNSACGCIPLAPHTDTVIPVSFFNGGMPSDFLLSVQSKDNQVAASPIQPAVYGFGNGAWRTTYWNIKTDLADAGNHSIAVELRKVDSGEVVFSQNVCVLVTPLLTAQARFIPPALTLPQGQRAQIEFEVVNTGNVAASFQLQTSSNYLTLSGNSLTLTAGQAGRIQAVAFTDPRTPVGSYAIPVQVLENANGTQAQVQTSTLALQVSPAASSVRTPLSGMSISASIPPFLPTTGSTAIPVIVENNNLFPESGVTLFFDSLPPGAVSRIVGPFDIPAFGSSHQFVSLVTTGAPAGLYPALIHAESSQDAADARVTLPIGINGAPLLVEISQPTLSYSFGSVDVTADFTVKNNEASPLALSSEVLGMPPDWTQKGTPAYANVLPGSSQPFEILLHSDAGPKADYNATLAVSSQDGRSIQVPLAISPLTASSLTGFFILGSEENIVLLAALMLLLAGGLFFAGRGHLEQGVAVHQSPQDNSSNQSPRPPRT